MNATLWQQSGFSIETAVLSPAECHALIPQLPANASISKGSRRLLENAWCRDLATRLQKHPAIKPYLAPNLAAVQCSYFEKSLDTNWLVSIHQDLSIPVADKIDAAGYENWSCKQKTWFVQPPVEVLQQLVAVRLHLDPCQQHDGPILVWPGSHHLGQLSAQNAAHYRQQFDQTSCCVMTGDVVLMKPLLLHASSKASGTSKRRVLHFLFGPPQLPGDVAWQDCVL